MIDHIIYASPNLDRGIRRFAADYGIAASPGGRHPGAGTQNALIGLRSGAYLEILGLDDEQRVPVAERFLRLERTSPQRFMAWCARANRSLQETREIAHSVGVDLGEIVTMSRKRPDGSTISWKLTAPLDDGGGVLPFYIDWGDTPNPATLLDPALTLVSFTLAHPAPKRIRAILAALGEDGIDVEDAGEPALRVELRR